MSDSVVSNCMSVALKMLHVALICYCSYAVATPLPTKESLFKKHTAVFNVTNPMFLENIKPEKVLTMLEDVFREVLEEIKNETYDKIDKQGRQHRRRRMLQIDWNVPKLIENRKRSLKADRIKPLIKPSHRRN
ncbi:Acyl-coenzyme A oxidase [Dirofilaria immitis]|nr:hypothetical protein [Dirofilaria immitis]